jgi:hypothetical protein
MCKTVASLYASLRHKEEYFIKYQNIVLEIQWRVLSMDTSVGRYSQKHVKYGHIS